MQAGRSTKGKSRESSVPSDHYVVYTDGACKGNGQKGEETPAGVGVYWGANDPRYVAEQVAQVL